jgi:hypothetical protein
VNFHRFHPNPEIQRKVDYAHQIRAEFLRKCFRSFKLRAVCWFRDLAASGRIHPEINSYQKPRF